MVHASTVLIFGLGLCLANDIPSLSIKTFDNVRAKLEELGIDTVRSKLGWLTNVGDIAQQHELQPLGFGLSASRRQMQDWLTEKAARETLWVKVGAIAAVLAALFSLLSWYAPLIKISISQ
jgi:hypothetical protein